MSENLIITNFDGVTFQDDYVPDCPICGMSHSKHPVDGEITFACGHYVDVYNEWFHDDEIRADAVKFATHAVFTSHVLGGLNEWFFDAKSDELNAVMTSAEIAEQYGIDDSTIRQAVRRGSLRARKSGNTLLVLRADAESRWGNKETDDPIDYDWLRENVINFISNGGSGDYDVNAMESNELAEFMVDYWRDNTGEIPAFFAGRGREWCIEQLTESFKAQRD